MINNKKGMHVSIRCVMITNFNLLNINDNWCFFFLVFFYIKTISNIYQRILRSQKTQRVSENQMFLFNTEWNEPHL